ncbi:tRNA pseudouridine synthase A [Allomyces macrogynus ATCC 38327]|uniref:tRNA pseudouridine synthase A n=1 Tax=Allomyces macrogynus (strain ATCC 38327) TaxID=578462 RepID=A0A0L0S9Z3_ALLM3|nr:tRNA pseudouridine synthase A [Allomyces macrogynus ATCC 38327]|eukprot:KNE59209.1 tRNA pseudouridine synthase A [Allomyces macrogynus ATCC 38327]
MTNPLEAPAPTPSSAPAPAPAAAAVSAPAAPAASTEASASADRPARGGRGGARGGRGRGAKRKRDWKNDPKNAKRVRTDGDRTREVADATATAASSSDATPAEGDAAAATTDTTEGDATDKSGKRLGPKRKVAVNPGVKTIEGDLVSGLIAAPGRARCSQLVSCKLVVDHLDDPVAAINAQLPAQIRVWDVVRVMGSFNSKNHCDGRIYEYILPTYVFEPLPEWHANLPSLATPPTEPVEPNAYVLDPTTLAVNREYRITPAQLEQVRAVLQGFVGTHNHHNFTIGKPAKDPSCKRYITSFTCSEPETYYYTDADGVKQPCGEWLSLKVRGQSFMLHQIRKMVGLAILLVKTGTPLTLQQTLLSAETKVNVPKAPGLGLLLEQTLFDVYNKRAKDQDRDAIDFDAHKDEILAFKKQFIYDNIVREEHGAKCFAAWLALLLKYPYQYRYLTPDGTVPEDYSITAGHIPEPKEDEGDDDQ